LLDWYYLHENPIPLDINETARQIRMRSHTDCIEIVLHEYFERTEAGWIHHRANAEIAKAGDKSQKASESAKARWNKAKDANALPTLSESNATHNTLHITQDTEHNIKEPNGSPQLDKSRLVPNAPISEIVEMYNTMLPMLARVTVLNDKRRKLVSARWREVVTADKLDREGGLNFFKWYFGMVSESRFLTGRAKDWKADFEFLFNPSRFPRVIEGYYHKDEK
jgi:uncharacterized protein YdaU (DUF1376 family)